MSKDTPEDLSAETIGGDFAREQGIEGNDVDALAKPRALSAAEMLSEGQTAPSNSDTYSGPIVDGRIVVETSQNAHKAGRQMRIPLMVGANSAETGCRNVDTILPNCARTRPFPSQSARG